MKNWKRIILIAIIWGWIWFAWFLNGLFSATWKFNIFSLGNWGFIIEEFRKGWSISTKSEWIFLSLLVLMIPIYLFGLKIALKIDWIGILRKFVNKIIFFFTGFDFSKNKAVKLNLKKNSAKNVRPRALDSGVARPIQKNQELKVPVEEGEKNPFVSEENSNKRMGNYPPVERDFLPMGRDQNFGFAGSMGASQNTFSNPTQFSIPNDSPFGEDYMNPGVKKGFSIAPSPFDEDDDFEKILLDDIKLPEREPLNENIPQVLEDAGYQIMFNISIGKIVLDILAVSEEKLIACVFDTEEGDWLADEEKFNGEDPLWFSESAHRVSPVYKLLEQTSEFKQKLMSLGFMGEIEPMFVVSKGTIINAEDMLSIWKEMNVTICRTATGGPDELKSFSDCIVPVKAPSEDTLNLIHRAL